MLHGATIAAGSVGGVRARAMQLSPTAQRALDALRASLPPHEFAAVSAWLTTFYPYQREWLLDWGRFSLVNKARQIGASHTFAGAAVLWGLYGESTTVISVGEREALEVVDKATRHAKALEQLGSRWARSWPKSGQVRLASGGRIMALPSTSGGRSYSSNVILDEAAYYQRPEQVWDGAAAVVMHGFRLRVFSTPNGVGNFWHALWTDPSQHEGYRKHETTIDQARAAGLQIDDRECWRMARGDPRVYDQLFRCSFVDNEQQYIPTAAIEACSADDTFQYEGACYAGLDIGLTADRTELVIIKVAPNGVRWFQLADSCKRTEQDKIEALAALAFSRRYRCKRLCVDSTGLGAIPAQLLQKRFGKTRVEAVSFTQSSKEDLATGLYAAFTESGPVDETGEPMRGMIRIPRSDTLLRDELCSLRRIVTSAGNVRYDAPRTAEGHADRAWALALALHACSGPDRRRYEIPDHRPQPSVNIA